MRDSLRHFYLQLGEVHKKRWIKPGSEDEEQIMVVRHLEENEYTFTAIPNSTYTTSKKQKVMNFILGLRPGLCDLLIVLKNNKLLFIEMKKKRGNRGGMNGSRISENQKQWIDCLNMVEGVEAIVCHGGEEAIETIISYEKY